MKLRYLLHGRRTRIESLRPPTSRPSTENRFSRTVAFLALLGLALAPASALAQRPDPLPPGMFSTRGNQIVDQAGRPVRLSCIFWQGLNAMNHQIANLTSPFNGYQANVDAIAAAGFNCIRVDFNNISLHQGDVPAFLSALDSVVAAAKHAGLRVIIDDHDNEGNYGSNNGYTKDCAAQQANGIWYDKGGASDGTDGCNDPGTVTQESFKNDWVSIASRYAHNNTVIGYDLWNEPLSYGLSTWGNGDPDHDIHMMYEKVGSAILSRDPRKLIMAECPILWGQNLTLFDGSIGDAPWGDCTGVRAHPVVFTVDGRRITNQVVYDVHLYPNPSMAKLFGGSSSSPAAIAAMNKSFGYLESQNIAPVWDGEGGTGFANNPDDTDWAKMLVAYLNGRLGAQGGPTFRRGQQGMGMAWMGWETPEGAGDNLGIINPDGTMNAAQMDVVKHLLFYPHPRLGRGHGRGHGHGPGEYQ